MKKKLSSILLSLAMVVTMMPAMTLTANAAGPIWGCLANAMMGFDQPNSAYDCTGSSTNRTITLKQNIIDDEEVPALVVTTACAVTLDLNGHVLNRNLITNAGVINEPSGSAIIVESGAMLTIKDSSSNAENVGYLDSNNLWHPGTGTGTAHNITGGVITGGTGTNVSGTYYGGAIYIEAGGNVTINNCNFAGNVADLGGAIYNNNKITNMSGTNISYCKANMAGGAIYSNGDGAFIGYTGSHIDNCTAKLAGGAVYNTGGARFETEGGSITNCHATNGDGGAVYNDNIGGSQNLYNNATFSNVTITGCTANNKGGAIYNASVIGVETVEISGNSVTSSTGAGGGIYNKFNTFIGKKAKVVNNKVGNNVANNLYICNGSQVFVGSGQDVPAPISGMEVHVSTEQKPTKSTHSRVTVNGISSSAQYFAPDNESYQLIFNNDHLELVGTEEDPVEGFVIEPEPEKEQKIGKSKITEVKVAKNSFTINVAKLLKSKSDGYQVRYCVKKNMKKAIRKTIGKKNTKTKIKVRNLKSKTVYYVQVRTIKKVNGKYKYSGWSKIKKVKTL